MFEFNLMETQIGMFVVVADFRLGKDIEDNHKYKIHFSLKEYGRVLSK